MAIAILHVSSPLDLAETSRAVYSLLGAAGFLEHASDNYPGGAYFQGNVGDLTVQVSPEDDRGFEDFQYWVTVKGSARQPAEFERQVESIVSKLLQAGHRVGRSVEERPDYVVRDVYYLDSTGALAKRREKVARSQPARLPG